MESDRHEKNNLISQYPEKARELRKMLDDWADGLEPELKQWYIVEKSLGGFLWREIGKVEIEVSDRILKLSVPRSLLSGADAGFRFKWSDNRQTDKAIDWLRYGDAAPNGRLEYQYKKKNAR